MSPQLSNNKHEQKRRDDFNREINRIIEEGLVKKKLDNFREKIKKLEKNIYEKEMIYKPTHLPKSFMSKKSSKYQSNEMLRPKRVGVKEVVELRSELEKQKRRYSMPNLMKINSSKYISYDSQNY